MLQTRQIPPLALLVFHQRAPSLPASGLGESRLTPLADSRARGGSKAYASYFAALEKKFRD
jgi:hypothetical protein